MKPLHQYIDLTLLKPDATQLEIEKLCLESLTHQFAAVCVNPTWTVLAKKCLTGSSVSLCSVVGFPLGANTESVKVFETQELVRIGVNEIDMVMNIGALKSKHYDQVKSEIQAIVQAAKPSIVKVILETCLLTDDEKVIACKLVKESGAHFVKTSTGFSKSGASLHDVSLMRQVVGESMGVKASGGIRDHATALAMIEAGASRIGTSTVLT